MNVKTYQSLILEDEWDDRYGGFIIGNGCNGKQLNLGVYFLFCLFGLAILPLFLWSSMQALETSLFFFVLRRQVWQVYMYQKIFTAEVLWISSDKDDQMAKIKTPKNPWTKI